MESLTIEKVDEIIKSVFDNTKVVSVDSVYEKSEKGDFLKLVISLHNLIFEDTTIIHTKFIFKTNVEKTKLIDNMFMYLYDYKCSYKQVTFEDEEELKDNLIDIVNSNIFGKYTKEFGEFLDAPASKINYYLKNDDVTNISVYTVNYNPKFKIRPCEEMTFDFEINVQEKYTIELNINLEDGFIFTYRHAEKIITKEMEDMKNLPKLIAQHIVEILDM